MHRPSTAPSERSGVCLYAHRDPRFEFVARQFEQFNEEAAYAGAIVLALLALTTLLLMSIGGRKAEASGGSLPAAELAVTTSNAKEGS